MSRQIVHPESGDTSSEEENTKWQAQVDLLDLMPVHCEFSDCVQQLLLQDYKFVPVTEYKDLDTEQLHELLRWSEQVTDGLNSAYFQLYKTFQRELRAKERLLDAVIEKSTNESDLTLFK